MRRLGLEEERQEIWKGRSRIGSIGQDAALSLFQEHLEVTIRILCPGMAIQMPQDNATPTDRGLLRTDRLQGLEGMVGRKGQDECGHEPQPDPPRFAQVQVHVANIHRMLLVNR